MLRPRTPIPINLVQSVHFAALQIHQALVCCLFSSFQTATSRPNWPNVDPPCAVVPYCLCCLCFLGVRVSANWFSQGRSIIRVALSPSMSGPPAGCQSLRKGNMAGWSCSPLFICVDFIPVHHAGTARLFCVGKTRLSRTLKSV